MRLRDIKDKAHLARLAGISQGSISNVFNLSRSIGKSIAERIAKALDISPSVVFHELGIYEDDESHTTKSGQKIADLLETIEDESQRALAEKLAFSIIKEVAITSKNASKKGATRNAKAVAG